MQEPDGPALNKGFSLYIKSTCPMAEHYCKRLSYLGKSRVIDIHVEAYEIQSKAQCSNVMLLSNLNAVLVTL